MQKFYYPMRDPQNPNHISLVPVSEEVYRAVYPSIWRTQKQMQSTGQCVCPRKMLWKCDGDCLVCGYYKPKDISLYYRSEADYALEEKLAGDEDTIDRDTLISLFMELEKLDPESRQICELMKEHSAYEAASILGIPYTTFRRRLEKIRETLKENLKDFF